MSIQEMFKREKSIIFLSVIEAKNGQGVLTYFNPLIESFNPAYKEQLISFLEEIIKRLRGKKCLK